MNSGLLLSYCCEGGTCIKLRKIPLGGLPFPDSAMYLLMGLGISLITTVPEPVMPTITVYLFLMTFAYFHKGRTYNICKSPALGSIRIS